MTARSALEEALEYLINEDHDKAVEAFHEFVVQKARAIHETLIEDDDLDDEIDEGVNVEDSDTEEVDEDEKDVDESIADVRHKIRSDEYFGRDELTTEDEGEDMDMDDSEAEMDLGDEEDMDSEGDMEGDMEGEEVVIEPEQAADLSDALAALQAKFDEIVGPVEDEEETNDMDMDIGDMGMNDVESEDELDNEEPAEESFDGRYMGESDDEEVDEDKEEVDEAVTHDPGVQAGHKTSPEGKHGNTDSVKHNEDAKLPESAEFDFDLTEEDFLDLEEGLKAVDVSMGGEQGGVKFAGEESNTKSPVAQRDKSDIKADSKSLSSKQTEHGTYDLETAPGDAYGGTLASTPHSGDNSHDKANQTGSPARSQVSKGGGLEKQKGYGEGEVGAGTFAGSEKNVKSPLGSSGTRNDS